MDSIGDLVDNLIYSFKSKSLKVSPSFEAEPISILLHYNKGSRDVRAVFFRRKVIAKLMLHALYFPHIYQLVYI